MLVLASASPRRQEILTNAGFEFTTRPCEVDETPLPDEAATNYVARLAEAKARAAWREGEITLGADTIVALGTELLGKPSGSEDAARMLRELSGRAHEVHTGYCLFGGETAKGGVETTRVVFRDLSDQQIAAYVDTGEPMDKAGAYGIQGKACRFIPRIEGCYFNVVGLPVASVAMLLEEAGITPVSR